MSAREQFEFKLAKIQNSFERAACEVIRKETKRDVVLNLRLSLSDRMRLFNLYVWSQRHQVRFSYIVKTLLTFWRGRHQVVRGANAKKLGVYIRVLCASRSESILIEQIKRDFPENEHKKEYRDRIASQVKKLGVCELPENPLELMAEYQRQIFSMRNENDKALAVWQRRRFRNNPNFL